MRIAVILNGISLYKPRFYKNYLPVLQSAHTVDVFETRTVNDAFSLAGKARDKRYDVIIPAGGDGTIHQVTNGMLRDITPPASLPLMAILPLGSGNDFARSLSVDHSPRGLLARLQQLDVKEIDVGELSYAVSPPREGTTAIKDRRYFLNVVDVGMGPSVVRGVLSSGRAFGSQVAYFQSILKTFFTYKPSLLKARAADWTWEDRVRTFAVANGGYYGNGLCVGPEAVLDDGVFEVFACGPVSVLDFILHSIPLKRGKHVKHSKVRYFKAETVDLTSPSPLEIEADGEIVGWLPAEVRMSGSRLRMV